jgi:hypothetical protein
MTLFNKKNTGRFILAIIVIFLIFLYRSYETRGWFYVFLDNQMIIPRQEAYTELYFMKPSSLPVTIVKGDKVSFSFTIHNLEGRSFVYPYEVFILPSSTTTTTMLTKGTSTLANGERTDITIQLAFARSPGRSQIVVRLPESGKEIRFHVNK